MPSGLKRYHHTQRGHYITFTCYHRLQRLGPTAAKELFERTLERVRSWYGFRVYGYVVMPEHVHLLVSEPERGDLAAAIQMLKQIVARKRNLGGPPFRPVLAEGGTANFWQRRYYDFNVWSERKFTEKLRYIHRNPGSPASPVLACRGGSPCAAAWWRIHRIGSGAAFAII